MFSGKKWLLCYSVTDSHGFVAYKRKNEAIHKKYKLLTLNLEILL